MLPPIWGSHSIQGGACHTSESCSVMLGDHSPPHLSFEAGIVPAVCREHWLPLAECPWLTDILFHLHFWQPAHELLPREAHSMPSTSPAFLSCSADFPGDISQRLISFTYRGVWAPWITLTGLSSIPLFLLSKTSLVMLSSRSERKTG